jgi:DNA-binding NarL/FixJ family response regulator
VVLLDLDMPGPNPIEVLRELTVQSPDVRVIVLSGHVRRELIDRAIEAGAYGYLSKNDDGGVLVDSIRAVARGEFVLGQGSASELRLD